MHDNVWLMLEMKKQLIVAEYFCRKLLSKDKNKLHLVNFMYYRIARTRKLRFYVFRSELFIETR